MIKIYMFISIFICSSLVANTNEVDTRTFDFEQRQEVLQELKNVIQQEESIAKAYEVYLLENYKRPASFTDLSSVLGISLNSMILENNSDYFKNIVLDGAKKSINYRLTSLIEKDTFLKNMYESDTFRKKTFIYNNKIQIILESNLAKNIYNLINTQNKNLISCDNPLSGKYCIKKDLTGVNKDHIYIYETSLKNRLLMYYYPKNYEKGPIVIIDDISFHDNIEFKELPLGVVLYDFQGEKYLKTKSTIRKVK